MSNKRGADSSDDGRPKARPSDMLYGRGPRRGSINHINSSRLGGPNITGGGSSSIMNGGGAIVSRGGGVGGVGDGGVHTGVSRSCGGQRVLFSNNQGNTQNIHPTQLGGSETRITTYNNVNIAWSAENHQSRSTIGDVGQKVVHGSYAAAASSSLTRTSTSVAPVTPFTGQRNSTTTNNKDRQLRVQNMLQNDLDSFVLLKIDEAADRAARELDKLRNDIQARMERCENDAMTAHKTTVSISLPHIESIDKELFHEVKNLRNQIIADSVEHQKLMSQITTLKELVIQERQKLKRADHVNAKHLSAMQLVESEMEPLRSRLVELEKSVVEEKQRADQVRVDCNATHFSAMQFVESKNETLHSRIKELEQSAIEERLQARHKFELTVKDERQRAKGRLDLAMEERDRAEEYQVGLIDVLQHQAITYKANIADLQRTSNEKETEITQLRVQLSEVERDASSRLADLQRTSNEKETEITQLRERMFGLRESFTELQDTLEVKEMESAQLRERMTGLQCNIDDLEKANHEENNQLISRINERSANMMFPASRSPWIISEEEQTCVLTKHLSQCRFSDNIHQDIRNIMKTEFGRDDDECVAIACNNVADTIKTQMWEIHNEALRLGVSGTPRDLSEELLTEILGCNLISAAIEIVKDCCTLSPFAINVLWNNLNIDHKTPRSSIYWDWVKCRYSEYMRQGHKSNLQILPKNVNMYTKGSALTLVVKEIFDDDGNFLGLETQDHNNKYIHNAHNLVCDETKKQYLSWQTVGLEQLAIMRAEEISKERNLVEDPLVFENSVDMEDTSFNMDNNNNATNDSAAEDDTADDVFGATAIARTQAMQVERHPRASRSRHRTRRSPQITVETVEIDGHKWQKTKLSGYFLEPIVKLEFSKGILAAEKLLICADEVARTGVNTEYDTIYGDEQDHASAGYMAFDEILRTHVNTFIHYFKSHKKDAIQNPNGSHLTLSRLVIMMWYKYRHHVDGIVSRLMKATRKKKDGVEVVVFVEASIKMGCKHIQVRMRERVAHVMRNRKFSHHLHWKIGKNGEDKDEEEEESKAHEDSDDNDEDGDDDNEDGDDDEDDEEESKLHEDEDTDEFHKLPNDHEDRSVWNSDDYEESEDDEESESGDDAESESD